ncbi:MAG: DUF2608 domain-containing protein, partial [Pseudomonadota bacterium]
MKITSLFLFIVFISFSSIAALVEHQEVISFTEFENKVEQVLDQNKQWTQGEILFVYDIDNTLMSTNQDLGGDAWFEWQRQLLTDYLAMKSSTPLTPPPSNLVATDFPGLFATQSLLFALSSMSASEKLTPAIVSKLQTLGQNMLLTSRGYETRNATERELKKNGYLFPEDTWPKNHAGFPGTFFPYDLTNLSEFDAHEIS